MKTINSTSLILTFLTSLFLTTLHAQHNWVRTNPGGGGSFSTIEQGPPAANGAGQIIAGSDLSGAYYSWNGGQSWNVYGSSRGVTSTHIGGVGFHPTNPDIFFLASDDGIFKSATGGGYFYKVLQNGYITDVRVAPSNPNIVYAASHSAWAAANGQVYKSNDGGDTWSLASNSTLPSGLRILKLRIHHTNSNVVYLVTGKSRPVPNGPARVFRSMDGGLSWTEIAPSNDQIMDIALDPIDSDVVYVSTMQDITNGNGECIAGNKGNLYRSTNQGTNWTNIANYGGVIFIPSTNNQTIRLIDPRCPFDWFADAGTWTSTDYGSNWTRTGDPSTWGKGYQANALPFWSYGESYNGLCKTISGSLTVPDAIFWCNPQWTYGSFDGGNAFNHLHTNETSLGTNFWQSTGVDNVVMLDIDINETNTNEMYIGFADLGLFRSVDGGLSWQMSNDVSYTGNWDGNGGNTNSVLCDPDRPGKVWACQQGDSGEPAYLISSSLAGAPNSWATSNNGLPQGTFLLGLSLDRTSPSINRTLYVTMDGNVYKSQDDGANWSLVLSNGSLYFTAVDAINGSKVYAGGADGLYYSSNSGSTWTKIYTIGASGNTWPFDNYYVGISDIEVDPSIEGIVHITVYGTSVGGIFSSEDGGNSWVTLYSSPYMRCLDVYGANNQIMYAGSSFAYYSGGYDPLSEGVLASTDGGLTWSTVNEDMPWKSAVTMEFQNGPTPNIFVGSSGSGFQYAQVPGSYSLDLDIQVALEGAYNDFTGTMTNQLQQKGLLPAGQSYNAAPWNYFGMEGQGWSNTDYPSGSVDWVLVSLRTDVGKSTEVARAAGLLLVDGSIFFPDNESFPSTLGTEFYIVVQHRNHIGAMSPSQIIVDGTSLSYDFRSADSYADAGAGQKNKSGTWVLYAGDGDQVTDPAGYDINGADGVKWNLLNGTFNQYLIEDFNLDGEATGADKLIWSINNGVFSSLEK